MTTKEKHKYFVDKLDELLRRFGSCIRTLDTYFDLYILPRYSYSIETKYGELVLHPAIPMKLDGGRLKQKDYWTDIFGKFTDWRRAAKAGLRPKWNHHYGYAKDLTIDDIDCILSDYFEKLKALMP